MSKGLKALDLLKHCVTDTHFNKRDFVDIALDVEQASNALEKELKALEIIKNKSVNVLRLKITLKQYGPLCGFYNALVDTDDDGKCLTQDEYDLLKEVLL